MEKDLLFYNQLKLHLKIFGRDFAGHEAELKKIARPATAGAGPTVEFLGEVTDQQKSNLMSTATAFIFCSDNEDFGIVPVEAMAHGCPVIGHNSGGTAETIVDGKTGVYFKEQTVQSLIDCLDQFKKMTFDPGTLRKNALKFSKEVFEKNLKSFIIEKYNEFKVSNSKH